MAVSVLNVAYPFAAVGPNSVGGAEQVLTQLDEALARAGEVSMVLACAGSRTRGFHFPFDPCLELLEETSRRAAQIRYRAALEKILAEHRVDVVHMHGIDFASYLPRTSLPVLVTLHLPLGWYPADVFDAAPPNVFFHCVSAAQRRGLQANRQFLPEIENGVDVGRFRPGPRKRDFVAALGRICPEKGFHHALEAARLARKPMLLAGKVFAYPAHQAYFETEIRPRLDRSRRFVGPLGPAAKRRLLASSRCLLAPSLVAETGSLVALEALACGTPVVAYPAGALAEIVEDGKTGFLVANEREMAEAIPRADAIDPEVCRARARERFSLARTQNAYLKLYRELAEQGRAGRFVATSRS